MISGLKTELESTFKDIRIACPEKKRLIMDVRKDSVLTILRFLRDKGYEHLAMISCTDWIEENKLELIYIVSSYGEYTLTGGTRKIDESVDQDEVLYNGENIILKTRIPREDPKFITAIPVFENSEPYEREIHELFGIDFKGHPRLIPLFLERGYKIPPFRKDFDTRKYVKDFFDEIPFVENKEK